MNKMVATLVAVLLFFATSALAAVNINTADSDELQQLNGIGKVKAEAIITDREDNGDFKSADDLVRVNGIGEKTLDNIRSEITVED